MRSRERINRNRERLWNIGKRATESVATTMALTLEKGRQRFDIGKIYHRGAVAFFATVAAFGITAGFDLSVAALFDHSSFNQMIHNLPNLAKLTTEASILMGSVATFVSVLEDATGKRLIPSSAPRS